MLNDDRCFLEKDIWQNVFRSVVRETKALSDSSGIVLSLWTTICPIPGLFKDVQSAVCNSVDIDMRTIGSLFARARETRSLLLQWRKQFDELALFHDSPKQPVNGKQYDTLGVYMANMILINRLCVSLDPRAGSGLEDEAQNLAGQILQLERRVSGVNPRASLFMAFKTIVAQTILDTKYEWLQAIRLSMEDHAHASPVIGSHVFERWVKLKGRKFTSKSVATMRV